MYTIYLFVPISVAVSFILTSFEPGWWAGAVVIGGFIGVLFGCVAGWIVSDLTPRREVVFRPETMVSMRTSNGVGGTFVWGTGSIQGETFYNFMIAQQDGSFTPRSVPADWRVAIIEDESLHGVGYWRTTYSELDPASPLYKWGIAHRDYKNIVRQEFRIPVGTVALSFNVE